MPHTLKTAPLEIKLELAADLLKCPEVLTLYEIAKRARVLVDDVLPQMKNLVLQDYGSLNDLCIDLESVGLPHINQDTTG